MASNARKRQSYADTVKNPKRFGTDIVFGDLDQPANASEIDMGEFRARQIAAVASGSPLLLTSNIGVSLGFALLSHGHFSYGLLVTWVAGMVSVSLLLLASWWRNLGKRYQSVPLKSIRRAEFWATVLGVLWAAFPGLFFASASPNMKILIVGLTLAASGIGAMALARIPTAAILYSSLTAMALALTSMKLGGEIGLTFGMLTLFYGALIAGLVLSQHVRSLERASVDVERHRKSEIINLLLNDFERGSSDWLWETDAEGKLTYSSDRFAEIAERDTGEMAGRTLTEIAGYPRNQHGWDSLEAAMSGRSEVANTDLEVALGGVKSWWQFAARPLIGKDGEFLGYRGVGRDVTLLRNAQLKLIQDKQAAEEASAAKTQFLAVMSHELKTPLNSIVGFSEILSSGREGSFAPESLLDYASTILESARHLQSLINDILDATRIEKGTMTLVEQETDAAEVAEVALKMCRDQAQTADVTLVAKLVDGVEIKGDSTRIKQVLLNLVTNAIKFSPVGGYVNVSFAKHYDGGLKIIVKDAGIGIKPEDLARVFEPFVQADQGTARRFGGIGLGLAIARKIARLHGGDIVLESHPGAGTAAHFVIPAARVTWPEPRKVKAGVAA
ncbi:MAG: PAS domain-containing protein [Rhizobiales bacterium]|nr:PAS domain-containing protein [Hyphomicrobiales bacterium]